MNPKERKVEKKDFVVVETVALSDEDDVKLSELLEVCKSRSESVKRKAVVFDVDSEDVCLSCSG